MSIICSHSQTWLTGPGSCAPSVVTDGCGCVCEGWVGGDQQLCSMELNVIFTPPPPSPGVKQKSPEWAGGEDGTPPGLLQGLPRFWRSEWPEFALSSSSLAGPVPRVCWERMKDYWMCCNQTDGINRISGFDGRSLHERTLQERFKGSHPAIVQLREKHMNDYIPWWGTVSFITKRTHHKTILIRVLEKLVLQK